MFKSQNFCHIASNNRNQVKVGVFVYRTTDDLATVLTSGYFNDRIIDINLHDLIIHEKIDSADATKVQRNLLCVTERSLENVGTTLIKSKWEGDIEQAIADIEQEIAGLDNSFVKIDGSSIMTGPLKFRAGSMRGAVAPYLNGVSFWKMDSQGNITNIANLTDSQFLPVTTNSIDLGNTTHTWKDAYVARVITSVLNNGHDIAVPVTNSADTLALKSEVDLAANSGRMITDQGVWYAKMYAATVAPSAENGTNYADFSQVDTGGNPIIVLYERQNGAWVQTQTIVPPAEYDGYVPITSKIWDIPEQAGQQGGRILWNHQSKDFTPYPQIISFENAALTGVSTAPTPTESSPNNQIVNKEYVDNKTSQQGYHPDLFDYKWADHICNDVQWLRADTFSWQSGAVYQAAYQHLADEYVESADWATPSKKLSYSTSWESINYIGTQFVALEFDGYISTSTDGTTWTTPVQNAQLGRNYWSSFVYNGSIAVAIGGDGHISTSTDGTSWTTATQNAQLGAHNWEGITYGNGKFVTIGYNGYISTSTDGTTWTSATQNAQLGNQTWRAIAYGNGVFVVINDNGYISTSTDGTTWSAPVQNAQLGVNYWNYIMFDGNQFFALGAAGYISTSVDGTTWTTAVQNTTLGNHNWAAVATNGTRMVAVGAYGYVSTLELPQTDVVAGIAVTYCLAADGHKICPASEESNVLAIYNKTGNAWYYIIDTTNQRFKLPRRHSQQIVRSVKNADGSWYRLYADGWVEQGGVSGGLNTVVTLPVEMADTDYALVCSGVMETRTNTNAANWSGTSGNRTSTTTITLGNSVGFDTMGWRVSGQSAIDMSSFQDGEKYLYFYVGAFTQTAIENTAGLNTELFNGKADLDLNNVSSAGKDVAVGWNIPDYSAGIVVASDIADYTERTYTAPADGVVAVYLVGFNGQDAYIKINDVTVERVVGYGSQAWVNITGLYPVKKGSVIKFKDGYAQATLIGSKGVTFFPFTK